MAEDILVHLGIFDLSNHHDERWRTLDYTQEQLNLDYEVKTSLTKMDNSLVLEILLKRSLTRSLIENIIPPGLLVVVSWVSNLTNLIFNNQIFQGLT